LDHSARMKAPHSRLATQRVYAGRIINVDLDSVRFPDGSTGTLEMVRHPGASAVVPILSSSEGEDPQLLLIKQFRYAADDFIYEIPAGKLDGDEDPKRCAERELREETGCVAQQLEHLCTFYTTPGFTDELIHAFVASGLSRGDVAHEKDEFMSIETVLLSQALEMIRNGVIKDAKSALAILFYAGFRAGH
jgi:ADP-ribose pyrophosphatase